MYLNIYYNIKGGYFLCRWDINYRDQLPEYLKPFYEALLSVYEEMEKEMEKEGKHYRIHYAKEAVGDTHLSH